MVAIALLQGLLPALGVWLTRPIIDGVTGGASAQRLLWLALGWGLATLASTALTPLARAVQALLADRLTALINLRLMAKAASLPDLTQFENPTFYDDLQVIQEQAAYQPINLLMFAVEGARTGVSSLSLLALLWGFHPLIPLLVAATNLPHAWVTFRHLNESFDSIVHTSPQARRMRYLNSLLLTDTYAKEVRIPSSSLHATGKHSARSTLPSGGFACVM